MNTLIHADIFFFITTIAVIFLAILLIVVLVYIIQILADIQEISRIARTESAEIAEDMKSLRKEVKDEFRRGSSTVGSIIKAAKALFNYKKPRN